MVTSPPGFGTGIGRKTMPSQRLKMAVLAPMPKARGRTTTIVNPGLLLRLRRENRKSRHTVSRRGNRIHFVDGLANPIRISQLARGSGPSICGRHASFNVAVRFYLEVRL